MLLALALTSRAQYLTDRYTATISEVADGLNQTKPVTPYGLKQSGILSSAVPAGVITNWCQLQPQDKTGLSYAPYNIAMNTNGSAASGYGLMARNDTNSFSVWTSLELATYGESFNTGPQPYFQMDYSKVGVKNPTTVGYVQPYLELKGDGSTIDVSSSDGTTSYFHAGKDSVTVYCNPVLTNFITTGLTTNIVATNGITYWITNGLVQGISGGGGGGGGGGSFNTVVAQYHMDDTDGSTLADTSGNNYNGAVSSGSPTYSVTGQTNTAIQFNSGSDIITVSGFPDINSAFRIDFWINTTDKNDSGSLIADGSYIGAGFYLDIYGSGSVALIQFYINTVAINSPDISDGAWHHIQAVYQSGQMSLFVDGTICPAFMGGSGSPVSTSFTPTSGGSLTIGGVPMIMDELSFLTP